MRAEPVGGAGIVGPLGAAARAGGRLGGEPRARQPGAAFLVSLLLAEREAQRILVEAETGVLQTTFEGAAVALQHLESFGSLGGDHGAHAIVVGEVEADLDPTQRRRLELNDQSLDAPGGGARDVDRELHDRCRRQRSAGGAWRLAGHALGPAGRGIAVSTEGSI